MITLNDILNLERAVSSGTSFSQREQMQIAELLREKKLKEEISNDPFIYFYQDVIKSNLSLDYQAILTRQIYIMAQEHAKTCTELVPLFSDIPQSNTLYSWLSNALKFADHIVLHYIQDVKGKRPLLIGKTKEERSRYKQVINLNDSASPACRLLDRLYQNRNKLEHRTRTDSSGRQFHITPDYRGVKNAIVNDYPLALSILDKVYKSIYRT